MTDPTRPQPVLDEAKAAGLIQALFIAGGGLFFTIKAGINTDTVISVGNALNLFITAALAAIAYFVPILRGKTAAAKVTPLESPQTYGGHELFTADQWERQALSAGKHSEVHAPAADEPAPTQYYARLRESADRPTPYPRRRLGRLPNDPSKPRVRLTALEAPATYTPPPAVDWYSKVPAASWGMDGNDTIGDCTCAEVDHCVKALQIAAGNPEVQSKTAEVVSLYSAVTGYTPSNPSSDQGAMMQDVRNYWRKNGVKLGGQKHTILLFAQVDHANHDLIKWCISRFGEVGVGFNFPASAMQQFDAGQPWTVVAGSKIDGGHAVGAVGYDADYLYVTTWGAVQRMAWSFWDRYVDESWTQLSEEFISGTSGDDPLAETAYQLGQQFAAVTGQPNPVPAPTPVPAPAPTPSPSPSPQPVSFPDAAWDAWVKHPRSVPKTQAMEDAMKAYRNAVESP